MTLTIRTGYIALVLSGIENALFLTTEISNWDSKAECDPEF
jgi:hypothetical protein